MNYRIPRAMCLAANYPVKNDPFADACLCVCVCVWGWVEKVDRDQLVSHTLARTHVDGYSSFG